MSRGLPIRPSRNMLCNLSQMHFHGTTIHELMSRGLPIRSSRNMLCNLSQMYFHGTTIHELMSRGLLIRSSRNMLCNLSQMYFHGTTIHEPQCLERTWVFVRISRRNAVEADGMLDKCYKLPGFGFGLDARCLSEMFSWK